MIQGNNPEGPLSVQEFAAKVKEKYPQYKDVDDQQLVEALIKKYPQYKSAVTFDPVKKKDGITPSESSVGESLSPEFEDRSPTVGEWFGNIWNGLTEGVADFLYPADKDLGFTDKNILSFIEQNQEEFPELYSMYEDSYKGGQFQKLGYEEAKARELAARSAYTKYWEQDKSIDQQIVPFIRQERREEAVKEEGVDIPEEIKGKLDQQFWNSSIKGLASSMPAMVTSGTTMGGSFFVQGYYSREEELMRTLAENPDLNMSKAQQETYKLTGAFVEAALEKIGLSGALKGNSMFTRAVTNGVLGKVFKGTKKATTETLDRYVSESVQEVSKRIIGGSLAEGETGALQQLADDGLKALVNAAKGEEFFDPKSLGEVVTDALYAGAQEAVGGGLISSVSVMGTTKRERRIQDISKEIKDLEAKRDAAATEEDKKVFDDVIKDLRTELKGEINESFKEYSNYSEEDLTAINDLNTQIRELAKKYNVATSDTLKNKYKGEIEALRSQKEAIESKYDAQVAPEAEATPEVTPTETVAEPEVTPAETVVAEPEVAVEAPKKTVQEPVILVKNVEDQVVDYVDPVTGKTVSGTLIKDGQRAVVETKDRLIDIGNFDEVAGRPASELGITPQLTPDVTLAKDKVVVKGVEYRAPNGDMAGAINYNEEGEAVSVTLETADGKTRTLRGAVAQEIVYQNWLQENASTAEDIAKAEQELQELIESDEEAREILEGSTEQAVEAQPGTKSEDSSEAPKKEVRSEEVEIIELDRQGGRKTKTESEATDPRNVVIGKMTIEYGEKGVTFRTESKTGPMEENGGEMFVSYEEMDSVPGASKFKRGTKEHAMNYAAKVGIADKVKPENKEQNPFKTLKKKEIKPEDLNRPKEEIAQIVKLIENFNKLLKRMGLKPVDIVFFNDSDYRLYYQLQTGHKGSGKGVTFPSGHIAINATKFTRSTLAHEMLHAYIRRLNLSGKKLVQFVSILEKNLMKGDKFERQLGKSLSDFRQQYIEKNVYGEGKSINDPIIAEEFLAEYVGVMSNFADRLSPKQRISFAEKIRRAVMSLLAKAGIISKNWNVEIKTEEEAMNFINGFVRALNGDPDIASQFALGTKNPHQASRSALQIEGSKLFNEPLDVATDIARDYMASKGLEYSEGSPVSKLDTKRAKRISDAYIAMKSEPNNPEVKRAYEKMAEETIDQYEFITGLGYEVEVNNEEPYNSSGEMIRDLRDNKRMRIFSTDSGFGDAAITDKQREENPLLQKTKYKDVNGKPLLVNDLFRFVHDFFGHAKRGNGFGPKGEENAWDVHSRMYTPLARRAMTSETRGQNSYVNFSGVNDEAFKVRDEARKLRKEGRIEEANELSKKAQGMMSFAEQKIGLLPNEFVENPYDNAPTLVQEDQQGESGEVGTIAVPRKQIEVIDAPKASEDPRPYIREHVTDIDIKDLEGRKYVTNMYDYTNTGLTELGNGLSIDLLGGRNYVAIMLDRLGLKIGDVSNLAAFNSKEQAEGFIRNSTQGKANLFAPHAGTLSASWQFQHHIFEELTRLVLDNKILSKAKLIELFNETLTSAEGKKSLKQFNEKNGTSLKNFNSFKKDPMKLLELLNADNNYAPKLRKAMNQKIATNKAFQKAIGVKNVAEFQQKIADPMNQGIKGGEIMTFVEFDPSTFKIVKTKPGDPDHHPSFGWVIKAKITNIYQPNKYYKSYDLTESYTKYNKNGVKVERKSDTTKEEFIYSNISSSAGAIAKVAKVAVPKQQIDFPAEKKDQSLESLLSTYGTKNFNAKTSVKEIKNKVDSGELTEDNMSYEDRLAAFIWIKHKENTHEGISQKGDVKTEDEFWANAEILADISEIKTTLFRNTQAYDPNSPELYHFTSARILRNIVDGNEQTSQSALIVKKGYKEKVIKEIRKDIDKAVALWKKVISDEKTLESLNILFTTNNSLDAETINKVLSSLDVNGDIIATLNKEAGVTPQIARAIQSFVTSKYGDGPNLFDISQKIRDLNYFKTFESLEEFKKHLESRGFKVTNLRVDENGSPVYRINIGEPVIAGQGDEIGGTSFTSLPFFNNREFATMRGTGVTAYNGRTTFFSDANIRVVVDTKQQEAKKTEDANTNVVPGTTSMGTYTNEFEARVIEPVTFNEIKRIEIIGPVRKNEAEFLDRLKDMYPNIQIVDQTKEVVKDTADIAYQIEWEDSLFGREKVNTAIITRSTQLQQAVQELLEGKITNAEYQEMAKLLSPVDPISKFFLPASDEDMQNALGKGKAKKLNAPLEDGEYVGLRLDIPAYVNNNIWVVTAHKGTGAPLTYGSVAWATDVKFGTNPKVAAFIAAGKNMDLVGRYRIDPVEVDGKTVYKFYDTKSGKYYAEKGKEVTKESYKAADRFVADRLEKQDKSTIGKMLGRWKNFDGKTKQERDASAIKKVEEIVKIENSFPGASRKGSPWRQIGMNPFRHSFFYDRRNGRPVVAASEVVQIGGLVYAKDVEYASWDSDQFTVDGYKDADGQPVRFQSEESQDIERQMIEALEKGEIPAPLYKKSWWQKVKEAIWRTPMEVELLKLQEKKEGRISLIEKEAREIANRIKKLAKTTKALQLVNDYMTYDSKAEVIDEILKLPNGERLLQELRTARALIDNLSNQLLEDPAFKHLPDELRFAIQSNVTTYLRTQYRFFTDKRYKIGKRRDAAVQAQFKELVAREIAMMAASGMSDLDIGEHINKVREDLAAEAAQMVDAYISDLEAVKYQPSLSGGAVKMPNAPFRRKQELPTYIETLLGKEKDPISRFASSAKALANIVHKGFMIDAIVEGVGENSEYILSEEPSGPKAKMYKKINDPYSKLDGKWVHTEIIEALDQKSLYSSDKAWVNMYFQTLKLARKSKVIWNVATWRKNLTGGWYFIMANGVANPAFLKDFARRTKLMFNVRGEKFQVDDETKMFLEIMGRYGVTGSSVDANLIGMSQAAMQFGLDGNENQYLTRIQRILNNISNKDKWLQEKYGAVDDYTKLIIFRSEVESYAKKLYGKNYSELNEAQKDEVHEQAAERVKQSTPTFSRLPKWFDKVAVIPIVGDFISFKLESLRSFSMNAKNAVEDIKKSQESGLSDVQRREYLSAGLRRIAGSSMVFAIKFSIMSILGKWALGDDEELEEEAKLLRPEWMDGQTIIPTSIDKDGNIRAYNYSSEDPYGDVTALVGGPESWMGSLKDFIRPNIAANLIFNLSKGEDIYGRKITDHSDSAINNALKVLQYTAKQLIVPPGISSSYRDAWLKSDLPKGERAKNLATMIAERSVIRDYKYNAIDSMMQDLRKISGTRKSYLDYDNPNKRLSQLDEIRAQYLAIAKIANAKGNRDLVVKAQKYIKRHLEPIDERYVFEGLLFEIDKKGQLKQITR